MASSKLSLTGSSFSSDVKENYRSTSIIYGATGAQKSSTVFLNWPEPIFTLNFDGNRDVPAFERAKDQGTEIYRSPLTSTEDYDKMDVEPAKKAAEKHLSLFWKEYLFALSTCSKLDRGSVCIDTFNELKPIICAAITGHSEILFKQYKAQGRLNQICRDIVNKAKSAGVHLCIIARESEIYVAEKGTGRYKPKVPAALLEAVDWAGYLAVNTREQMNRETRKKEILIIPSLTMTKCGGNTGELAAVYTEDDWQDDGVFAWVCYNQWTKSKLEDWK